MQLLFEESEEFGLTKGIGFFKGKVENFNKYDVERQTYIGWNKVKFEAKQMLVQEKSLENDLTNNTFYFVHSFAMSCKNDSDVLFKTTYGYDFVSAFERDNILGMQFHPEKSHKFGMEFFKNFMSLGEE